MVHAIFPRHFLTAEAAVRDLSENAHALRNGEDVGIIRSFDYNVYGRMVRMDVLGYDIDEVTDKDGRKPEHTATLQMHFLTDEEIPFCDPKRPDYKDIRPNAWSTSTIRQRLNEDEFIEEHFGDLAAYIVPAIKETPYDTKTEDRIFPLSKEEIDMKSSPYPFYHNDPESRARVTVDGEPDIYRLRSAHRGSANYTWYVNSGGYVSSYGYATHAYRALPSFVIDIS